MEPLRNYAAAAEWLGVSQRWLEDQVQAGKVPHTRLGRCVRFSQAHLDAIVAAGEARPETVTQLPSQPSPDLRPAPRRTRRAS